MIQALRDWWNGAPAPAAKPWLDGGPDMWRSLALPGLYTLTGMAIDRHGVRIESDLRPDFENDRLVLRIKCGGRVEETAFSSWYAVKTDLAARTQRMIDRLVDQHDEAMRREYGM